MSDLILVERRERIATVTFNRPEKRNAMTKASWRLLADLMAELSADPDLRAVVLRGAGGKAFAAGADIAEFETERADPIRAKAYGEITERAMVAVAECRHPTIALIEGNCIGGGLEIAVRCDLRIAGRSARFGIPSNRLGLVIGYGELKSLVSVVGKAVTLEILLEARIFDAEEALAKGLVNRMVADDRVAAEAYATAQRIAAGAPLVNRWHKQFLRRLADPSPISPAEHDEIFACYGTADFAQGRQAFVAKTKPVFEGR